MPNHPQIRDHRGLLRACVCGVLGGCAYCRAARASIEAVLDVVDADTPCHTGKARHACGRCNSLLTVTPSEGLPL